MLRKKTDREKQNADYPATKALTGARNGLFCCLKTFLSFQKVFNKGNWVKFNKYSKCAKAYDGHIHPCKTRKLCYRKDDRAMRTI